MALWMRKPKPRLVPGLTQHHTDTTNGTTTGPQPFSIRISVPALPVMGVAGGGQAPRLKQEWCEAAHTGRGAACPSQSWPTAHRCLLGQIQLPMYLLVIRNVSIHSLAPTGSQMVRAQIQ